MKWWVKWGITYTLAHLPGGRILHHKMVRSFGELAHLESSTRFANTEILLEMAQRQCGTIEGKIVAELGTGWLPAVPLGFFLAGARLQTFDVVRLAADEIFAKTRDILASRTAEISRASGVPEETIRARLQQIAAADSLAAACEILDGRYHAPYDTTSLPFDSGEVDLVVSNLVLQCIPNDALPAVLAESWRILKAGGVALHRIRMSDEYAADASDRNHLEYLKYPDRTWDRWFNHSLKHINRLRASQFLELFEQAGFRLIECRRHTDFDSIPFLKQLELAPQFRNLEWDDLATVGIDVVLQKEA